MADKFINQTGLLTIKNWIEGKFALDADLDALDTKVDGIISEGGEPNTIESISVNGTPVTPDGQKNVALTVPAATSDLTNDGDGTSNFATESYVQLNGGKIDVINVNNTPLPINNKAVNIDLTGYAETSDIPTAVSELSNDSGYQTASDVSSAISSAVASAYKFKGSVATVEDLPASGNETGDVYDVQSTGVNYAWIGTSWDALGQYVDVSVLWTSTTGQANTLEAMTVAEINAILNPSA